MIRIWDADDGGNSEVVETLAITNWQNIRHVPNYTHRLVEPVLERVQSSPQMENV